MAGVVLTGHGGLDKLEFRDDLPTPRPGKGEVLIRVKAAGVNNQGESVLTEILQLDGEFSRILDNRPMRGYKAR